MLSEDEIKPGERYTIELLCIHVYPKVICFESPTGSCKFLHKDDLECVKHAEAKPKYDPCRKFKKGDKVRLHHVHGRPATHSGDMLALPWKNDKNEDVIYEVVLDEKEAEEGNGILLTSEYLNQYVVVHVSHIELVTPVEELVSFRVGDFSVNGEWSVWKNSLGKTEIISSYKIDTHPNAKKAAEAECARLNAEHRKEQV